MNHVAMLIGYGVMVVSGLIGVCVAVVYATYVISQSMRELRATADLQEAINEWHARHPEKSQRYPREE